jgi:hypothetical protein
VQTASFLYLLCLFVSEFLDRVLVGVATVSRLCMTDVKHQPILVKETFVVFFSVYLSIEMG